jgi:VCBS repeat protein
VSHLDGVAVLLGVGDGTLGPAATLVLTGSIGWVHAGDLDRDGAVDLVAANSTQAQVEVMFGVGDGTFRPPVPYATPASSYFAMLADLNGDGRPDLVAQDAGGLTVRLNPVCGGRYFVLPPCRLVDTRNPPGPSGGPALAANSQRTFPVAGRCGIPATALAAALNLVAVDAGAVGDLRAFPAGTALPTASTLNFVPGRTRANNAMVALGADGQVTVQCDMPAGSTAATHFVLDVFGYYQ